MNISVIDKTLKFVDMVWMGRIKEIKNRGEGPKEHLRVEFNQVMPLKNSLPAYNGTVKDLKTAI